MNLHKHARFTLEVESRGHVLGDTGIGISGGGLFVVGR